MGEIDRRRQLAALVHSVGKYISRTARNIGAAPISAPLLRMLIKDLYHLDGEHTASAVFARLAAPIEAQKPDRWIDRCRVLLRKIDEIEPAVRRGDDDAVHLAATMAIEIDTLLRSAFEESGVRVNPGQKTQSPHRR